jgi:hypothetical protein
MLDGGDRPRVSKTLIPKILDSIDRLLTQNIYVVLD